MRALVALVVASAPVTPPSVARASGEAVIAPAMATDIAFANAAFPGLVWVDTLVVMATPILASPFPHGAGVITRMELRDEPTGRDLATLLSSTAGLQVRRLGADGASAIPSMRGGSAAQVRLYLDGMPLPDAWDGGAALDMVPTERLTAVEIHRGVVPVALGGVGGIGAINLLTSQVPGRPFVECAVGSFGAQSLRGGSGWISGDGLSGLDVVAHARRAENDFEYLDHHQTFHNDTDDSVRTRVNARVSEWGGWAGANRLAGRVSLRAGAGYLRRDGGRPGPLTYLTPHATVRFERGDLRLRADLDHGLLTADVAAGRGDDRLYDPVGEFQRADPGVSRSLAHDLGSRVVWSPWRGRIVAPSLGVTWRRQWQQDAFEDEFEPARRRTQEGVFAALEVTAGRVRLTPAWRWQHTTDEFPFVPRYPWEKLPPTRVSRDDRSPSVGAVWEALTGRLFVEAHAARASREPGWVELFGVRGGIDGNRDLKPETITSYDAAVTWRPGDGRWDLRLAAFDAASDDKIIYVQHNQNASWAVNIGAAHTRGLECEAAVSRQDRWRLAGNLTWQDARDRSGLPATDGKPLPFLPPVEARLYGTLAAKGWEPWAELMYQATNSRDRIDTEIGRAPARTRLNLGLGRTLPAPGLSRSLTLHVSVVAENVTDSSVYDVEGFPLPGRTWRLAVSLRRL